ncbi:hypothetical protein [Paraburkholderia sp. Cpub6]|uniref:hypothetical protein n=1 Tax=Paraburkholderia sp. Cpub6 TaxID=2723094 RepID=UPI00161C9076|nr:hypothetical protein [Paraburkholderia sp. Cpub6]MBB5460242.1 hypothetical protein [Paraburkholderia sp. Cpub6]
MDHSNRYLGLGNAAVFPEVLIWAMGQRHPELIEGINEHGKAVELRELLSQYCSLRGAAERLRSERYFASCEAEQIYNDDFGYLTPDDLVQAFGSGDWSCDDPAAKSLIQRAAFALAEQYNCDEPEIELSIDTQWFPDNTVNQVAFELTATRISDLASLPRTALAHATHQLTQCDNVAYGSFWDAVYTSAICDWLEQDAPEVAAEIVKKGLSSLYVAAITDFRSTMISVEEMWKDLSHPLRALLLQVKGEHEALNLLRKFAENFAKCELEVSTYAALLWEIVKRRNCPAEHSRVYTSDATNALVEAVRSAPANEATCHLVDVTSLPDVFRIVADEKQALVVRLPDSWLEDLDALAHYDGLEPFFRKDTSNGQCLSSLSISHAFCCDYDALWPLMFTWRRHVPVMYVFAERCAFALHVFRHFIDLRRVSDTPARHWPTVSISATQDAGIASSAYVAVSNRLAGNRPLAVLPNITDLRTTSGTTTLKDTFLAAHHK